MSTPLRLRPLSAHSDERIWPLRLPFHYGDVTLLRAQELHLALAIECSDGRRGIGYVAELAAPKWFEKLPGIPPDESVARLRVALRRAVELATTSAVQFRTIAELTADLEAAVHADSSLDTAGLTRLERGFGVALVERAAIDAVCRLVGASFETVVLDDLIGLKATLSAPTLAAYLQWQGCKAGSESVAIRHTVGLDDPLIARPGEGRPTGLAEVIATDQVSRFKLKVPATIDAALDRLNEVAVLLNHALPGGYTITLDANEAFDDPDPFAEFMNRLATTPRLGRFWRSIAYLEQPFRRDVAFDVNLGAMSLGKPVIIDESDDASDAFARAIGCGYGGVSVKTCKGVVHGLRNLMLAKATGCFVSAEDLCVQPGLGLQQNLALAGVLGVPDCERNGHHYGPGPIALPLEERMQFEALHPDLYSADTGTLNIERGELSLRSTRPAKGFGTTVVPVHANPSQIR